MQSPYFGPVMAYFGQGHKKTTEIIIKIQQTRIEIRTTPNCNKNEFQHYVDFIRSLRPIPTTITSNEAIEQFDYFISPTTERKKYEQHYLNARIMYDTMHQMIHMLPQNTEFVAIDGGYKITVKMDDGIEVIKIKKVLFPSQSNGMSNFISIDMPNVGLHDRFVYNASPTDMIAYIKAQEYLDIANGEPTKISPLAEFTRWDKGYKEMMQKIIDARRANVKK